MAMIIGPNPKRKVLKDGKVIRHEVLVVDEETGVYVFRPDPEFIPNISLKNIWPEPCL